MKEKEAKEKLIIRPTSIMVGGFIAVVYTTLLILIPYCVPEVKNKLTSIRLFPYIIFIAIIVLAIIFAILFRKQCYKLDLGIWPMVLGSFIYYFLIKIIGFYMASFLIVLYTTYFWKFKNYITICAVAVLTPAIIYVFFTLCMNIHMPEGLLF